MRTQYKKIGSVRRTLAALLALVLPPVAPMGVVLMFMGEWVGAIFALLFGGLFGGAMVYAAVTGRSPEHLKHAVYSGGWWPGGS